MPDSTVGIDISKTHLDAYMAPAGKAARFTNDAAGFNALIAWVDQPVRSVVYEPTGPWHRAFEEGELPVRPGLRGLVGPGSPAELDGREAEARQDIEDGSA